MLALLDWATHLAISPGKQAELVGIALRQAARFQEVALQGLSPKGPCIEPLQQDERFSHPAWREWPYNLVYQGFLLTQQWWHNATTGVRGVTCHHEDVLTFAMRQWLDMLSPSNFLPLNPEVLDATLRESGANLIRGGNNFVADHQRFLTGEPNPETKYFVPGKQVATTPGQVVMRNRLAELIQYAPTTPTTYAEPVLIIPSWIMKYYILDLSEHNSLVRYLVSKGHTVFILSWNNPDESDRDVGLDDYLRLGPLAALDAVCKITGQQRVHGVGYCLGGTLLSIAAAKLAHDRDTRLKTVSLLAAETDFEEPGELSLFIDASQVAYLEDLMWSQGYLKGEQMGGSFTFLHSRDLVWSRMVRDYLLGNHQPLNDLMAWNADVTRMPYRMHSEYLTRLYLHNDLAHGAYKVDGQPIALNDVDVPLFVVGTVKDHVSPWKSVYKIHLLAETEITFVLTSGGHNAGIVSEPGHPGRSFQVHTHAREAHYVDPDTWQAMAPHHEGSWWPAWQRWLATHSAPRRAAVKVGAPSRGYPALGPAPGRYVFVR